MKFLIVVVTAMIGCRRAPQPQPAYYGQQPPPAYGQQQPPPAYGQQPPPVYTYTGQQAPVATGTQTTAGTQQVTAAARRFSFNGRAATARDLELLAQIEAMYGKAAPEGDYWYDPMSGAAGAWGGPTLGFLPAGLDLGGPLPSNASGGGSGRVTGVFVNGRELHPVDVKVLYGIYGQVLPGRWWVDGKGNAGQEGGPALINLVQLAQQKGKGADSYYRTDGTGNNAFVGGGCVSLSTKVGSGDSATTYDYYGSGC